MEVVIVLLERGSDIVLGNVVWEDELELSEVWLACGLESSLESDECVADDVIM